MKVVSGLFEHMVLQRNGKNVSDARIEGSCAAAGEVRATVRGKGGKPAAGLSAAVVGKAAKGRFTARLRGAPAGGPYEVTLCVGAESLTVRDVLVGDVWVLGGQSNMQGCGLRKEAARPHPMVRAFFMDDAWRVAQDPIHNLWDAVDPVHAEINGNRRHAPDTVRGVGPGVAFGQEMFRRTGVPQGLLACGHGGTSMSQWDPALKRRGGHSLYGATVRRFRKNGGKVAGVAWYQGCSDTLPAAAALYVGRMKRLIAAMRRDFGDARLPFVLVQIGRVYGRAGDTTDGWNRVQAAQLRLQAAVPRCACVPAIDLRMDDGIHIGGTDQQRLGRRLGQAMAALLRLPGAGKMPITFRRATVRPGHGGGTEVVVEFDNVTGRLRSGDRPVGFDLGEPAPKGHVFDARLAGNTAVLRTLLSRTAAEACSVSYGAGYAPVCNVIDEADRAVPVFGPVSVGEPVARTPFVRRMLVSPFLPGRGKLHDVGCPAEKEIARWAARDFPADFCDLHLEWGAGDQLVFYAARVECDQPMRLEVQVGYDGPVKLWIDGVERLHDPKGTNPAAADARQVPWRAGKGAHRIVMALGSNEGRAWGVFLRLRRLDVTRRQLRAGPEAWRLPRVTA
jgi:sialate O-acetylesterase